MKHVIVKLRDNGGSFNDASQGRSIRVHGVATLLLTPNVARAIKMKALVEITGDDAINSLKKFYTDSKKNAEDTIKGLGNIHEKLVKNDTKKRADAKIAAIKKSLKANLAQIEKDMENAGEAVKIAASAEVEKKAAAAVGSDGGDEVVIPEGTPAESWKKAEITAWLDREEVEYKAKDTIAELLTVVGTYLIQLEELDVRVEYIDKVGEEAPEDMSVEDMKNKIEAVGK